MRDNVADGKSTRAIAGPLKPRDDPSSKESWNMFWSGAGWYVHRISGSSFVRRDGNREGSERGVSLASDASSEESKTRRLGDHAFLCSGWVGWGSSWSMDMRESSS